MKRNYISPRMELIQIENSNLIAASNPVLGISDDFADPTKPALKQGLDNFEWDEEEEE